jgi:two-component system response regulator DevR
MFNRLRARESTDEERLAELNDREHQLLELVAEGLTNRQIGARLYLSEKTVKNYVSAMLQKLNMRTRTEAAVFATRLAARRQAETTPQRSG